MSAKLQQALKDNFELSKKVDQFSGDAQELVKVKDLLVVRTNLLKESCKQVDDLSVKYKEE